MSDVIEQPKSLNPFGRNVWGGSGGVASAEQARAITDVQSALVVAHQFPRDRRRAMDDILQECTRPELAAEATYEYVRGGSKVTGPSIRLAETVAQCWGNIETGVKEISRHGDVSECMAYAWDLQTNVREVRTFTVRHWRDKKDGGGYRLTDERDIYELVANYGARRKRACIIAIVAGDVWTAATAQCEVTNNVHLEVTPELLAGMVQRFGELGVTKAQLEKHVQRRLETIPPAMAMHLRKVYNSINDGMSTPGDWFDMSTGTADAPAAGDGKPAASRMQQGKDKLKARTAAKTASKGKPETPPASSPPSAAGKAADEAGDDAGPVAVTADLVRDALKQAKTKIELAEAADYIAQVEPQARRIELDNLYEARMREFDEAAGNTEPFEP
jgi:hypothetical protein